MGSSFLSSVLRAAALLPLALLVIACGAPVAASEGGAVSWEPLAPPEAGQEAPTRFVAVPPEESGLSRVNRYDDPRMWGELYREFTLGAVGSGVAAGDFDNDGRPDLFAVSKTGQNRLYRQVEPFVFEDVAEAAGILGPQSWSVGATFVDIDGDGWLDLYVCHFDAPNRLYVNQGDGTFAERAAAYGIDVRDASVMGAFADYDRDGDMDLYLQTNILDYRRNFKGRPDYLFRNEGDGSFADVTGEAGIWGISQGHSATWWDYNNDGWPDIYVANDFENSDRLYRNNGDGTFTDVLAEVAPHTSYFSMGSDFGDINNDGLVDFLVGDMAATTHYKDKTGMAEMGRGIWEMERVDSLFPMYMRNALYLNTGVERFGEVAYLAGLDATDWTWAVKFADLDNSGFVDLFVTNGNIRNFIDADLLDKQKVVTSLAGLARLFRNAPPLRERNLAFRNEGELRFENVSEEWGLDHLGVSFGATIADFDRDGRLDLVTNNLDEPLALYRNVGPGAAAGLLVRLEGRASNAYGVGARLTLETERGPQTRQIFLARGALSSDEPLAHFGLGPDEEAGPLTVHWPSGRRQTVEGVSPGRLYTLVEPDGPAELPEPREAPVPDYRETAQFEERSQALGLDVELPESKFNDLAEQPLLPRRLSRLGPGLAWAELEDGGRALAVGGTAGHPDLLLVEGADGRFAPGDRLKGDGRAASETLPLLWLDADADGRLDLYAGSGSVERDPGHPSYADRLYLGQDDGRLAPAPADALPDTRQSAGAAAAADFDADGRLDLFVGGRAVPGEYPKTPRSSLLRNEGGAFVDVTEELAPGLAETGMVTAAVWSDATGDGRPDLLLAREWDSVALFENTAEGLVEATEEAGFAPYKGWWNSIAAADFNGDGRMDYAVGNAGLNTKYRASPERPTMLFSGVFDASGKTRLIEAQYEDGDDKLYPIRPLSKLRYSLPDFEDKFDSFDAYARSTIEEIFPGEALAGARRLEATTLESGVFLSQRDGSFAFRPLPRLAQAAPAYGIAAQDFDGDGRVDLYLAQNSHSPEPTTGRFAGGISLLLRGDGEGGFAPAPAHESGLVVKGDAKALVVADLHGDGWPDAIVSQNKGPLRVFANRGVPGRNSFSVSLQGPPGNPEAVGARVTVERRDGTASAAEIRSGSGYLSQSQRAAFFGYGDANAPEAIAVRWPDGETSRHPFEAGIPAVVLRHPGL